MDLGNILFIREFEIAYDPSKVIQDKQKCGKERLFCKIGTGFGIAILALITLLLECMLVILFTALLSTVRSEYIIILQALVLSIVPLVVWHPLLKDNPDKRINLYPANVKYHLATEGKTILDKKLYIAARIVLSLEDSNHCVTEKSVYLLGFNTVTRAGIEKVIVDLDRQTIFLPCQSDSEDK